MPPAKGDLPPPVQGFGADTKRLAAATAAYGEELSKALTDDMDPSGLLDDEPTRPITVEPEPEAKAVLEPVSEDAHPVAQRRVPTQPELLSDALAAIAAGKTPGTPELVPDTPQSSPTRVPEPRPVAPNRSPSPVPLRMGLFSADRATNLLAGAAIGLLLTIVPARKLAHSYGQELLTQPLLELADSIEHPLAVDAGLLRKPQTIAAEITAGGEATRDRYLMIWLLAGLPIGLGLGLVPRFWA